MSKDKTEITVTSLPECDVCRVEFPSSEPNKAEYDGRMVQGQWAHMCSTHFESLGIGLGTGRGQKLTLATEDLE